DFNSPTSVAFHSCHMRKEHHLLHNKGRNFRFKSLETEPLEAAADKLRPELLFDSVEPEDSFAKRIRRRILKKDSSRVRNVVILRDLTGHRFECSPPTVGDHRPAVRLRLHRYDSKIFLPRKKE